MRVQVLFQNRMRSHNLSRASLHEKRIRFIKSFEPLKQQEKAKKEILYCLVPMLLLGGPTIPESAKDRVSVIHITGDPGIGKSLAVGLLADFFEMHVDLNYRRPPQFIHVAVSQLNDRNHIHMITGPPVGITGYGIGDSLVSRLIRATECMEEGIDNPFIIIHFDELCKCAPALLYAIAPLLTEGRLSSSCRTKIFSVPSGTHLLCIFTSNFGSGILDQVNSRAEAEQLMFQRMIKSGINECDVARMGHTIFFQPIKSDLSITESMGSLTL